jgi:hypothetical protein
MIGTLRADLRRVEITLAARIDARVAANDSLLRDQVQREGQELRAEMAEFREDMVRRLVEARDETRRHIDALADNLRDDIRLIADRLVALDAKAESIWHAPDCPDRKPPDR